MSINIGKLSREAPGKFSQQSRQGGGGPGGSVRLQDAYDAGNTISQSSGRPVLFSASNGTQLFNSTDKGVQSHTPVYHLGADQSLVLDNPDIDTIYINDISGTDTSINIQDEISGQIYADNATFTIWSSDPVKQITINALGAATVDGGSSVTPAAGQKLNFSRVSLNTWVSDQLAINNNIFDGLVAEAGITITQDAQGRSQIGLSGSGASAAYGYLSSGIISGLSEISFSDQGHYFSPFLGNADSKPPVIRCTNLAPYNNGSGLIGIQNVGTTTEEFDITLNFQLAYGVMNLNAASNNYCVSGCIGNPNPGGGPDGSFAPIDVVIGPPYKSNSDKSFTVFPNFSTTVNFPAQVSLAPGQVYYCVIRNAGPSNVAANTSLQATSYSFTADTAGDVSGSGSGVTSLNGLTGVVQLTSADGTITYTVDELGNLVDSSVTLPAGFYAPAVTILSGANSVVVQAASYDSTSPNAGGRVSCSAIIDVAVDASEGIVQLLLPGPIAENFTASSQSGPIGFGIILASGVGMTGQAGAGWFNQLYAYTPGPNASILFFEAANISTTYRINVAWSYIIQPAPLALALKKPTLIYSGIDLCAPEFKKLLDAQRAAK